MRVLLLGFTDFPGVVDNPAARLVRALDGQSLGPVVVVGREMPVSYARSAEVSVALVAELRPDLVLGVGVAVGRAEAQLEGLAVCESGGKPDVDGLCGEQLVGGRVLASTLDVVGLSGLLGLVPSEDAGRYVCNAWLYQVLDAALGVPVGFLHVPSAGVAPAWLLAGLRDYAEGVTGGC